MEEKLLQNNEQQNQMEMQNLNGQQSAQFDITKQQLIQCMHKLVKERKFDEELQEIEKLGGTDSLLKKLNTNMKEGINIESIQQRKEFFGSNEKEEIVPQTFWELLKDALEDFTLRILIICAIISIIVQVSSAPPDERSTSWIEGFAILVAVAVCSGVTAFNDYEKERQFQQLNKVADAKKEIQVIREGKLEILPYSKVVVGDLVVITEGMDIPADGFLVQGNDITADESSMTGESRAVKKSSFENCLNERNKSISGNSSNISSPLLMSGTRILTGEGTFIVIVVGDDSCEGEISRMLRNQEVSATPLQEKLDAIASDIGKFGLWSAILIVLVLIIRWAIERWINNWDITFRNSTQILRFLIVGVTVIVVAIPEGLPLSVTISLAYSVKKMLKDQNLVRKLQACETMGGADVICSDKTGTLTQNIMHLTHIWTINQPPILVKIYDQNIDLNTLIPAQAQLLFMTNTLCNSTAILKPVEKGNRTEIALLQFAQKCGFSYERYREKYHIIFRQPFNSANKFMSTLIQLEGHQKPTLLVKGAPEILVQKAINIFDFKEQVVKSIDSSILQQIASAIEDLGKLALRTLVLAYKDQDFFNENIYIENQLQGLTILALVGIKDILREEVPNAVKDCFRAGISVKMVTGDFKTTARAVAMECGIIQKQSVEQLNQNQFEVIEGPDFYQRIGGIICKNCQLDEHCKCPRDEKSREKFIKEHPGIDPATIKIRVDVVKEQQIFQQLYPQIKVMARSRPKDKYALVTGLKQFNHVVAVTGDGTNDAPALKKADVGFSMGKTGTGVAKEASDIILLDDNFNSIVKAVMWGRNIYECIRKFLQFQLTVNVGAVLSTLIASAITKQEPLTAIQLLWLNLIMDSLASLALATEAPSKKLLENPPHQRNEYIINNKMFKHILGQSIFQFLIMLILIFFGQFFIPEQFDNFDQKITQVWQQRENYLNPDGEIQVDLTDQNVAQSDFAKFAQRGFFAMKYSNPQRSNEEITKVNFIYYDKDDNDDDKEKINKQVLIYDIPGTKVIKGLDKTFSDGSYSKADMLKQFKGQQYEFIKPIAGPSRHLTFVFSAFVWIKINDEFNIISGITQNFFFILIVGLIIILQLLITLFGGKAFNVYRNSFGITSFQFVICLIIGFCGVIWSWILKIFALEKLPQFGEKRKDPYAQKGLKSFRKPQTLQKKFSSVYLK